MRRHRVIGRLLCAAAASFWPLACFAQFYSQNFDVNDTANWRVNNNGAGTNSADFFFDYSSVGIPPAPQSAGTTRGLKIGANLSTATAPSINPIPGISVSPLGKSFTGNYELVFDWWSNYAGPLNASPATSTQLSTFGVLTSGNVANYDGKSDGVFFAATGNGGVPAGPNDGHGDFSVYSSERQSGYQIPHDVTEDAHALYFAESRDNADPDYVAAFPGGVAAPAAQGQSGVTPAGSLGFQWHRVEIEKMRDIVSWRIDGKAIASVFTSFFTEPTGGTNIMLGHSDVNFTTSSSANFPALQFTLIDNVRVASLAGDYDRDGDVDEQDYLEWRAAYGTAGPGLPADGNGDNIVDAADYTVWRNGLTTLDLLADVEGAGGVALPIPEPVLSVLVAQLFGVALATCRRRR